MRRPERGRELLSAFGLDGKVVGISDKELSGLDILINASTMGMGDAGGGALALENLGDGTRRPLVFDMVYYPLETGLICAARKQGHAVIGGLDMLVGQAASAFEHLFGHTPPRECADELRALLTA